MINDLKEEILAYQQDQTILKPSAINTILKAGQMKVWAESIFTPNYSIAELDTSILFNKGIELLTAPIPLGLPDPSAFVPYLPSSGKHPSVKNSEFNIIMDVIIRAMMQERPKYFEPALNTPISIEMISSISLQFFQEFISIGSFNSIISIFQENIIKNNKASDKEKQLLLNCVHTIEAGVKCLISGEDPIDYFLNNNLIPENGDILLLLKGINPEFSALKTMEELPEYNREKWQNDKYSEFKDYLLNLNTQVNEKVHNILEPNILCTFWETVYRNQYGFACYKIVCESFQEEYQNSEAHQIAQQIWAISQLDTLNENPKEAKSRMPGQSFDGLYAPNFGYRVEKSNAYKEWLKNNTLVRACGDIIVDAFHYAVDFGDRLDIKKFLDLLYANLNEDLLSIQQKYDFIEHEYYDFLAPLELYILNKIYGTPFISNKNNTIISELKRITEEKKEDLFTHAENILEKFQKSSKEILKLRPTDLNNKATRKDDLGFVLGIGFNGELFNSPNYSNKNTNEVYITFSKSERKEGGNLLLYFIKQIATSSYSHTISNLSNSIDNLQFNKYKELIKLKIKKQEELDKKRSNSFAADVLEYENYLDELESNSSFNQLSDNFKQWLFYEYMIVNNVTKTELIEDIKLKIKGAASCKKNFTDSKLRYEDYMDQLKSSSSLDQLSDDFKNWIQKSINWYSVPSAILIAEEMPVSEHAAQEFARNLLFDALNKRSFSQEYKDLAPWLFLHWQDKISGILPIVQTIKSFTELSVELKSSIEKIIDKMIWKVHPQIIENWINAINDKLKEFIELKTKPIVEKITNLEKEINLINKGVTQITRNLDKKSELQNELQEKLKNQLQEKNKIFTRLNQEKDLLHIQAKQTKENLLCNPSELDATTYEEFRKYFFEEGKISACIEPLFARVLGHDRFFSVFISKKTGKTEILDQNNLPLRLGTKILQDVINPCKSKCQHHVLGHVYTGDMLLHQSVDDLDYQRQIHKRGDVPDIFMSVDEVLESLGLTPKYFESD